MSKKAAALPDHPDCLNCGTELRGQYCGTCGQRSRSRLISLWELVSDAFGDLLELDSRLWQTLLPLLIRPGRLTYDYLQGKRARFMPPFRMYLVLSVVFFVVAFFDPRDDLSLLFEPEPEPTPEERARRRMEEFQQRRETEELMCLTPAVGQKLKLQPVYSLAGDLGIKRALEARRRQMLAPRGRRQKVREEWSQLLGDSPVWRQPPG